MARPESAFMKGWTHTRAQEPSSLTSADVELLAHCSVKTWRRSSPARRHRRNMVGGIGVDCEGSAENYGRRQFRSNQREIWRGLGQGLIGAGTRLCIHLSMRSLHQQSSPSWLNQSPHLTPTSSTSIIPNPSFCCIPRISHRDSWRTTPKKKVTEVLLCGSDE